MFSETMQKDTDTVNRYLPHNTEAERIVLSSLIVSSEAIEIALQKIRVEYFILKIIKKFLAK